MLVKFKGCYGKSKFAAIPVTICYLVGSQRLLQKVTGCYGNSMVAMEFNCFSKGHLLLLNYYGCYGKTMFVMVRQWLIWKVNGGYGKSLVAMGSLWWLWRSMVLWKGIGC
jgi:hypothetical protein